MSDRLRTVHESEGVKFFEIHRSTDVIRLLNEDAVRVQSVFVWVSDKRKDADMHVEDLEEALQGAMALNRQSYDEEATVVRALRERNATLPIVAVSTVHTTAGSNHSYRDRLAHLYQSGLTDEVYHADLTKSKIHFIVKAAKTAFDVPPSYSYPRKNSFSSSLPPRASPAALLRLDADKNDKKSALQINSCSNDKHYSSNSTIVDSADEVLANEERENVSDEKARVQQDLSTLPPSSQGDATEWTEKQSPKEERSPSAADKKERERETISVSASSPTPFILVVDDEKLCQVVARKLLRGLSIDCDLCGNGLEALSLMEESLLSGRYYDCILMDCQVNGP